MIWHVLELRMLACYYFWIRPCQIRSCGGNRAGQQAVFCLLLYWKQTGYICQAVCHNVRYMNKIELHAVFLQSKQSRVTELQTGTHIFWISEGESGKVMLSFLLLQDGGLTTGPSPPTMQWARQWNLDADSADDEKYERGRHNTVLFHAVSS